jgi:glycosyltransferase involved in cell wall biosynthesis
MTGPFVSIVIPCYNAEKWVAEAIESALAQTWQNKEIIVIDDGSTDCSVEVISSFGAQIRSETGPNRGGCAARNRGLELARGEWVQFLDADDSISPEKIRLQMESIAEKDSAASTCRLILSEAPNKEAYKLSACNGFQIAGREFLVKWLSGDLNKRVNPMGDQRFTFGNTTSWLMSKEIVGKAGGWNEGLSMCQDSDFFARIAYHSDVVDFNGRAYGYYRVGNASSVSSGADRRKAESFLSACEGAEKLLRAAALEGCERAIVANYFSFIQRFYPLHSDLINYAFGAIKRAKLPIWEGIQSPKLRFASRLVGVRAALMLKRLLRG